MRRLGQKPGRFRFCLQVRTGLCEPWPLPRDRGFCGRIFPHRAGVANAGAPTAQVAFSSGRPAYEVTRSASGARRATRTVICGFFPKRDERVEYDLRWGGLRRNRSCVLLEKPGSASARGIPPVHPSTRFVRGEIVCWKSLNSNVEHRDVVLSQYNDEKLGDTVVVRTKHLRRPQPIRAYRLSRQSNTGPTLARPGMLA